MKLRTKRILMTAAFLLTLTGCGDVSSPAEEPAEDVSTQPADPDSEEEDNEEQTPAQETEEKSKDKDKGAKGRKAALVTDGSSAMENGFNQAALMGVETYADAACVPYACYSAQEDTETAYREAILTAIEDDAELVVCVGPDFEEAVGSLQEEYKDVYFLLLGGVPKDAEEEEIEIADNVHCIIYKEEEAGYLAGYMSVLEGYRKFGFIGGEDRSAVEKYGCGYLQGIDAAAQGLEVDSEVQIDYWYVDAALPVEEIGEMATAWYQDGTEIIFTCGGMLYEAVLPAAEACDGMMIGADVDQSEISGRFLTSAKKGIESSIVVALDDFFANGKKWPEDLAGAALSYGAREKCIGLPMQNDAWRFQNVTVGEYLQVLARLRTGEIQILADTEELPETAVSVVYHNQQEEEDS